MLMMILLWVRTRGLKLYVHECHFDEKAMPSAGIIPFLRSTLCSFNNTCSPQITDGVSNLRPPHDNDTLPLLQSQALSQMETSLKKHLTRDSIQSFNIILRDLETLSYLVRNVTHPQTSLAGSVKLKAFFKDGQKARDLFGKEPLNLSLADVDLLLDSRFNWSLVPQSFDSRSSFYDIICSNKSTSQRFLLLDSIDENKLETLEQIRHTFCDTLRSNQYFALVQVIKLVNWSTLLEEVSRISRQNAGRGLNINEWRRSSKVIANIVRDIALTEGFESIVAAAGSKWKLVQSAIDDPRNNTIRMIQVVICGRNASRMYDMHSRGPTQNYEEFEEEMKQHFIIQREDDTTDYVVDNSTTSKCNALFRTLERGTFSRVIWKQIKPFIRGKIIYSPDSPAIKKLLKKIHLLFQPISLVMNLTQLWLNDLSPKVAEFLYSREHVLDLLLNVTDSKNIPTIYALFGLESTPLESGKLKQGLSTLTKLVNSGAAFMKEEGRPWLDSSNHFLQEFHDYLQCIELNKFEAYSDENRLVSRGLDLIAENKLWAGLVFENIHPQDEKLPPYIRYKIRMDASKVDSTKKIEDRIARPGPRRRPAIDLKYVTFGFSYLQDMIESAIIQEQTGIWSEVGIYLQQFPYPCYIYDQFVMAISRSFPLFMVLSWVYTSSMIIKSIVHEKEKRLKEVMKAMGLGNGVLWVSWFIDSFMFMAASCILLVLILVYGQILQHSDALVIFLFLICYCIATIMQSFLLSTLVGQANVAAAAGGMIFFMSYLPYPFLVLWEEKLSLFEKMLGCLVPNVAFGFGCSYFAHFEEEGTGANWNNMFRSPIPGDSFGLTHTMGMLLLDACILGILAWYIEAVFPGEYGVPKPWYFFVTRKYWLGIVDEEERIESEESNCLTPEGDYFEEDPTNLPLGINIRNLTKIYNGRKLALDNLSLNFYEGQITSFLGHNGAGKTTTISILTGIFPPTSGTAKIYGADIRKDMDVIRKSLGTCPQFNVLFDELTVFEHIWFYAAMKGTPYNDLEAEANQMINDLGLNHKRDEISKKLSGGMQRKLSVGIAFVGNSKTVILDEPTAGVDPYSRRAIWELLLKYKAGRTVILTTHHMDEADLLGDRIAVIAQGKLRCIGSSLFLKARFGSGYYLTLVKTPNQSALPPANGAVSCLRLSQGVEVVEPSPTASSEGDDEGVADINRIDQCLTWEGNCSVQKITEFVQVFIPMAQLLENVGCELSFLLPLSAQSSGSLQHFLESLDKNLDLLQISSYGISDTPLEEVFLRVSEAGEEEAKGIESLQNAVKSITEEGRFPSRLRLYSIACRALQPLRLHGLIKNSSRKADAGDPEAAAEDHSEEEEEEAGGGENVDSNAIPLTRIRISSRSPLKEGGSPSSAVDQLTGWHLIRQQFFALQTKRYHHTKRNSRGLMCEIVLPAIFICFSMIFTLILPPVMEEPPLELTPWLYGPPLNAFFANDAAESNLSSKYIQEMLGYPGMGTKCLEGIPKSYVLQPRNLFYSRNEPDYKCYHQNLKATIHLVANYSLNAANRVVGCSCGIGTMKCPAGAGGLEPPSTLSSTGDIVYNMTARNISDWLVKTYKSNYKKRYGGFTFGIKNPMSTFNYTAFNNIISYVINLTSDSTNKQHLLETMEGYKERLNGLNLFNNVKVWFNNKGWASSAAYMNALNNLLLRSHLPSGVNKRYYGISVVNHPMNFTQEQLKDELMKRGGLSLLHAVCILFAMSFVPASFVLYLIEDRITGSKHLQFVSGVNPFIYWIAAYIWDICNYLVPAALCVLIFVAFDAQAYVSEINIWGFIILLLFYGFASIPLMYPTCYLFEVPSSAFVVLACLNLFIGIVTTISTFVLELFDDEELQYVGSLLKKLFLIFPHYCLGRGLMEMSTNHLASQMFARFGFKVYRNPFDWNYLGRNVACMAAEGVVGFLFVLLLESRIWFRIWNQRDSIGRNEDILDEEEDEDVVKERARVLSGNCKEAVLKVENLSKVYRRGQQAAVNKLCLAVNPGECFGLLGVNGAGKTTTFKMLTGDVTLTMGDAHVSGFSINTEMKKARQHIGYCPQFDALDSLLTGKEHLQFYGRLKGIPAQRLDRVVKWAIRKLGLTDYANFCAGTYSGGNKRKLSTAIALIGNPSVVFLDEPTSGMDPSARRFLWNCVIDVVREGCAVILTSHSMEECEALCTRLAVMVNGKFRCLGSIQHLKNKFGEGYTVTLRVSGGPPELEMTKEFMSATFGPDAVLKETHLNQMDYQIDSHIALASIFKEMEKARKEQNIEDYSVSQTTLDQVFIRFARFQSDLRSDL